VQIVLGLVGAVGIVIALFLLLRDSSDLRTISWLPKWRIVYWIDYHGELRNTPAFAILAVPFLLLARGRRQRFKVIMALAAFVAVTEFCQRAIKTRWFDWNDIWLGWLGLFVAWGTVELFAWRQRVRYRQHLNLRPHGLPARPQRP
jgi:hypothetical protein